MKRLVILLSLLLSGLVAQAGERPYNEAADVKAEVHRALTQAEKQHKPVLLIFGANWCEDCQALDQALKSGPNAELMGKEFLIVKVDVGNFDRNVDVDAKYGNPIKNGIPAAVIVSGDNQVLYATHGGELADARRMGEDGIYRFFKQIVKQTKATK